MTWHTRRRIDLPAEPEPRSATLIWRCRPECIVVKFVGVYQLPSPLALAPSVLEKSFRTRAGGLSTVVKTPSVSWTDDDRPYLVPPVVEHLPTRRGQGIHASDGLSWENGVPWGDVASWRPADRKFGSAWVNCVAVEFALPKGSFDYLDSTGSLGPPHGGTVAELFRNVDSWFLDLLAWVGVARDHDTDHLEPLNLGEAPGQGLTIRSVESDGRVSSLTSSTELSISMSNVEPVNLATWRSLLRLVDAGTRPHDSHLLLRGAHIARRRDYRRRAVIDAGTATELVLAEWNVRSNGNRQPPRGRFKTLGWYVIQASAVVPNNAMADLVNIRNNAVHNNYTPTRAEMIEALNIASTIVNAVEPLPF